MNELNMSPNGVDFMDDNIPYDYVIELRPDDEYRQSAEALKSVKDFDDLDIEEVILEALLEEEKKKHKIYYKLDDNSNTIPSNISFNEPEALKEIEEMDIGTDLRRSYESLQNSGDIETSDIESGLSPIGENTEMISKEDFISRMNLLRSRKEWILGAARRSSLGFQDRYQAPDTVATNRFLVALAGGVEVQRHQTHHKAELVRLYSEDGCISFHWDQNQPNVLRNPPELSRGKRYSKKIRNGKGSIESCCGLNNIQGMYSSCKNYWFFNRKGNFKDSDIIAVHPACRNDPTSPGFQGTPSLRNSLDIYNESLTFSLVIWNMGSVAGYYTLDIECDNFENYTILLHGFFLISVEAATKRSIHHNLSMNDAMKKSVQLLSSLWFATKSTVISMMQTDDNKHVKPLDPIELLFKPSATSLFETQDFSFESVLKSLLQKKSKPSQLKDSSSSLPPAQFLGWTSAGTQIWARLKMAGLEVKCLFSWDLRKVILNVRCPQWRLEEVAEHMHLKLRNRDGTLKRFRIAKRDSFAPHSEGENIFRSSERQQIIDFLIRSKIKDGGAELNEGTELGQFITQKFPLHMPNQLSKLQYSWLGFWREPVVTYIRPEITDRGPLWQNLVKLFDSIVIFLSNLLTQPLDDIADYYGEGVAFYFAYLGYYTGWLIVPAIAGLFVFCFQIRDGKLDHWMCVPYSIYIMLWAAFKLAYWRQYASVLAFKWGVLGFEMEETERPQFVGKYVYDEELGEIKKEYPIWKRALKYTLTIPLLVATMLIMFFVMTTFYSTQTLLYEEYVGNVKLDYFPKFHYFYGSYSSTSSSSSPSPSSAANAISQQMPTISQLLNVALPMAFSIAANNNVNPLTIATNATTTTSSSPVEFTMSYAQLHDPKFWTVMFLYPCLYGILVDSLSYVFEHLALFSNDFENHRTQTQYLNRLIVKVFTFRIFTVFTTLYYIAFFSSSKAETYLRISVTIFCLMTVGQWWGIFLDIFIPSFVKRIKLYFMQMKSQGILRIVSQAGDYLTQLPNSNPEAEGNIELQMKFDHDNAFKDRIEDIMANRSVFEGLIAKRRRMLEESKSAAWSQALSKSYTTFQDYTNIIAQLGFILFFSAIFPLAPLIALINNILLIRLHAFKLCYVAQRPIAQKSSGIGVWEDALQVMSVVGIVTSCGIMGYTSDTVRGYLIAFGTTGLALLLFGLEHTILLVKYFLHTSIPRIPDSVLRAQARGKLETTTKEKSTRRRRTADATDHLKYKKRAYQNSPGGLKYGLGKDFHDDDNQDIRSPTTIQSGDFGSNGPLSHEKSYYSNSTQDRKSDVLKAASNMYSLPCMQHHDLHCDEDSYSPCNFQIGLDSPSNHSGSTESFELNIQLHSKANPTGRWSADLATSEIQFDMDDDSHVADMSNAAISGGNSLTLFLTMEAGQDYTAHEESGLATKSTPISFLEPLRQVMQAEPQQTILTQRPTVQNLDSRNDHVDDNNNDDDDDDDDDNDKEEEEDDDDDDDDDDDNGKYVVRMSGSIPVTTMPSLQHASSSIFSSIRSSNSNSGNNSNNKRESWTSEFQKRVALFSSQCEETRLAELQLTATNSARLNSTSSNGSVLEVDHRNKVSLTNVNSSNPTTTVSHSPKLIPIQIHSQRTVPSNNLDDRSCSRSPIMSKTTTSIESGALISSPSPNVSSVDRFVNQENVDKTNESISPATLSLKSIQSPVPLLEKPTQVSMKPLTEPVGVQSNSPHRPIHQQQQRRRRAVVVSDGPNSPPKERRSSFDIDDDMASCTKLPVDVVMKTSSSVSNSPRTPPSTSISPLRSCLVGGRERHQQALNSMNSSGLCQGGKIGAATVAGMSPNSKQKKKITFQDDSVVENEKMPHSHTNSAGDAVRRRFLNPFAFATSK